MFVKLRYQSHAIFSDDPSRFVAIPVILESVIDRNSCHPNVYAGLQWIAFGIEAQDRRMLRNSVAQQNHINAVVKIFIHLTRWFLSFQFVGNKSAGTFQASTLLRKRRVP